MSVRVYLVVDGHGECRLTKRRPTLDWDEVAFPITVEVPQGWGQVYDDLALTLTIPPPPEPDSPRAGRPETSTEEQPPRLRSARREL